MGKGMGDGTEVVSEDDRVQVKQSGMRVVRGHDGTERAIVLECWSELYVGAMRSQQQLKSLQIEEDGDGRTWTIRPWEPRSAR